MHCQGSGLIALSTTENTDARAVELGVPVVPIYLRGVYAILPKGSRVPRRGPVEVTIGAPLRFPPGMDYAQAAQQLEREIRRLSALSGY